MAAPTVTNQDPPPGAVNVRCDVVVKLSILDDVKVDLAAVVVYVGDLINPAYDGSDPGVDTGDSSTWVNGYQAPYDGGSSTIVESGDTTGFDLVLVRSTNYTPDQTITVRVVADDLAAEGPIQVDYVLNFEPDTVPPVVVGEIPARGSKGVSPRPLIKVPVQDTGRCVTGVKIKTTQIYVEGELAFDGTVGGVVEGDTATWVNGIKEDYLGEGAAAGSITDGVEVTLSPKEPFAPAQIVDVRVVSTDNA